MFDLTAHDIEDHIEEYVRLAREEEDRQRARDGDHARPRLCNTQRMVKLHAIFRNPYHRLATEGLSALDMMHLCAVNLAEREDFKAAGKLWSEIARYHHVRKPQTTIVRRLNAGDPAPPEPAPPPPPPPEPYVPSGRPALKLQPLRPQSPFDHFVDSLPDRQRTDMILLREAEARNPPNGPNAEQRFMSYKTQLQRDSAISGF